MRLIGFAGWSGSGKTTLIEQLIAIFTARGLSVSLVKHSHHDIDVDLPGADSWRHRTAGCREVIVAAATRWALFHELRGNAEPPLAELLARLSPCDLVLVEGYKRERLPKIEVHRASVGKPLLFPGDPDIVAIACDGPLPEAGMLPCLDLNAPEAIADFILRHAGIAGAPSR